MHALEILQRPRRLRRTQAIRNLVQETRLNVSDLIAPLFVCDGDAEPQPVDSMPGVYRLSINDLAGECEHLCRLGISAVAIFPCIDPALKDESGSFGLNPAGTLYRAVRAVKKAVPELAVITDIALDPYTTHGHDGVLDSTGRDVDNDRTVVLLAQMAVLQAEAGSDIVAPSDMMDGRIEAIRNALDLASFSHVCILSYAAKFASSLYGPFRDAVGSLQAAGTAHLDKRTYQLNPANALEALRDALLDEHQGADIVMVKPAGWYLDIIYRLSRETHLPVAAYQISGEYAQIHAASRMGWVDLEKARDESLLSIKRAGADMILTYFAKAMAESFFRH